MKATRPAVLLTLLACLTWAAQAFAAFTAEVDRKELYVNEHVLLTLSLTDSETRLRAEGVSPNVDLTVLAGDFDLGAPRADFRFNINRNRGRSTSSIAVELFPRAPGRLRIPAFTVDGQSTAPIELRVLPLPADAAPEVFVRSGVGRGRLHAREQTLLYLDLYHRVDLASARLGGPLDSRPRLALEAHPLPAGERGERVGGLEYRVTRTAWAVSPVSGEDVTLLLPDVWVETRQGRQWRLPFSEEDIEVRALPAGVPADMLIGRPQIERSDPGPAAAGEAIPWEIVLRSDTALNALPMEIPLERPQSGLKVYMDPPERRLEVPPQGGVRSVAVYRGHLLAESAGDYRTPAISLPYYDIEDGTVAVLDLPGQAFRVSPAPAASSSPTAAPFLDGSMRGNDAPSPGIWPWLTVSFALLWLATLALWWSWRSGSPRRARLQRPAGKSSDDPRERLLTALDARTLEQGLRQWREIHGRDEGVEEAIRNVQRLYYRRQGELEEGKLAQAVEHALATMGGRTARRDGGEEGQDPWSPRAFHPGRTHTRPAD